MSHLRASLTLLDQVLENSLSVLTIRNLLLSLLLYAFSILTKYYIINRYLSSFRHLQRPPGGEGTTGHVGDIMDYTNGETMDKWIDTFGQTFAINGSFHMGLDLYTVDSRAINHIFANPYMYRKPFLLRNMLRRYLSEGLLVAEGGRHKAQRKVAQKMFSRLGIRDMESVVQERTFALRDILLELCTNRETAHPIAPHKYPFMSPPPKNFMQEYNQNPSARIMDIYAAWSRSAYDMIGKIAIGHDFNCLTEPLGVGGEMYHRYERMQTFIMGGKLRYDAGCLMPWLDYIWPTVDSRRVKAAMEPLERFSRQKLKDWREKRKGGVVEKGHDLISLMLEANMSPDTPPDMKLYDKEMIGQLATFMFAGSETTTGTLAFAFHALSILPEMQTKLRQECLGYGESLEFDKLDTLPYLDAFIKEVIRTVPSIPTTVRTPNKDDIIPLAHPIKNAKGETLTSIKIRKGETVHIPIQDGNMSPIFWGSDGRQFNPERWFTPDEKVNLLSFIEGPRRCIGYKLAMMELKIGLFTLIRSFDFGAVQGKEIGKWNL